MEPSREGTDCIYTDSLCSRPVATRLAVLACRLRAEAVCRPWRLALRSSPLHTLRIGEVTKNDEGQLQWAKEEAKLQWVIISCPAARRAHVRIRDEAADLEQKVLALNSLEHTVGASF